MLRWTACNSIWRPSGRLDLDTYDNAETLKASCKQALDVCSSIHDFADAFQKRNIPLYALINNAGVFMPPDDRTEQDFEVQLGTNHFGPFYLTHLLLHNLEQSAPSRIVNLG